MRGKEKDSLRLTLRKKGSWFCRRWRKGLFFWLTTVGFGSAPAAFTKSLSMLGFPWRGMSLWTTWILSVSPTPRSLPLVTLVHSQRLQAMVSPAGTPPLATALDQYYPRKVHLIPPITPVCGLPPTSRRKWDWSPGSNPKQEAPLWAVLFPTQVCWSPLHVTKTAYSRSQIKRHNHWELLFHKTVKHRGIIIHTAETWCFSHINDR